MDYEGAYYDAAGLDDDLDEDEIFDMMFERRVDRVIRDLQRGPRGAAAAVVPGWTPTGNFTRAGEKGGEGGRTLGWKRPPFSPHL